MVHSASAPLLHELAHVGYVSSTVANNMFLNLRLSSVTEHNFDQKYTTSWVMDDLHHQILHVTQASMREQAHASHSIPTECKRHHCCSAATAALRLDHPPLASVCVLLLCLNSAKSISENGLIASSSACVDAQTHCFSLSASFHRRQTICDTSQSGTR